MKKILIAMAIFLSLTACSNRKYKGIAINDNIPTYFYGFNLGDKSEEAKAELDDSEFRFLDYMSCDTFLHFEPKLAKTFTYQGSTWHMLDLNVKDGRVWGVNFVNSFDTEKEAAENFKQVKSWAKRIFKVSKASPTKVYFMGDDDVMAGVSYFHYKSVGGDSLFAVSLAFQKNPRDL